MKKLITLTISVMMLLSFSATVFAEVHEGIGNGQTYSGIPVKITVNEANTAIRYWVDVQWESLDFTYVFGTKGAWNAQTHTYSGEGESGWVVGSERLDTTSSTINVINHSNAPVAVSASLIGGESELVDGVQVGIDDDSQTPRELNSAEGIDDPENAYKTSYTVTVTGAPTVRGEVETAIVKRVSITVSEPTTQNN